MDQSANLLKLARTRFPNADWIESRMEDFTSTERFAGAVCWDALFHVERSYHEGLLRKMATFLYPRGKIMLTVGGSDHPPFTDTMFDQPFYYDSHPPDKVIELLMKLGFNILTAEFLDMPTSGRDKGRYAIVAIIP
ncbi:MAG: class I SAM-dependent methyltransferase [Candidatus Riflebacteria bacterium]|nr:class I SAM-dependent methyltransferase [Candidatus Riflebacteria bacterium]